MAEEKPEARAPKIEMGRRTFLQLVVALGGLLSLVPYVPAARYLTAEKEREDRERGGKDQPIFLKDGWLPGNVSRGNPANIKEAPTNSFGIFVFPSTGDAVRDANPFKTYVIMRLPGSKDPIPADYPKQLLGDKDELSSFRVYSRTCLHLFCLPSYLPVANPSLYAYPEKDFGIAAAGKQGVLQCPCHGSIYRVSDGLAVAGPASKQTAPNNALPALLSESRDAMGNITLDPVSIRVDDNGFLYVKADVNLNDLNANGIIPFGRWIKGEGRQDQTGPVH